MAKLVAIEWDGREARVAVGSPRGSEAVVEEAFAVDLASAASDDETGGGDVGPLLAEALIQRGLGGSEALVSLGRSNIELRVLSLPPAPPEELPEMVRFQAMQAFTAIGDDWPLDYVELDAHEDSLSVLAAVISPSQIGQIQDVCAQSELKPRCLVLRPFAKASLLLRSDAVDATRDSLVIDLLADEVDLTTISKGQVVFMRTVRRAAQDNPSIEARALVGEIRRTIGAAQNQMGGGRIEQIVICGSDTEHAALHEAVSEALSLDVISFDPFQAVRLSRSLKNRLPENAGRFAPLLGMLASEFAGTGHALDFLNPRKRPAPPSNKRRNLTYTVGTAAVVAAIALGIMFKRSQMDRHIAELKDKEQALIKTGDVAKQLVKDADAVKVFTDGDITWLDEMREVAQRLPDADHAILDEVSFTADLAGGGTMILKGNVTSSDVILEFEEALRYDGNIVRGKHGSIDRNQPDYKYMLDTTIIVPPDVQENGHSKGRPYRDEIRKELEAAAAKATETTEAEAKASATTQLATSKNDEDDSQATPPQTETAEPESQATDADTAEPPAEGTEVVANTTEAGSEEPETETDAAKAETVKPVTEPTESAGTTPDADKQESKPEATKAETVDPTTEEIKAATKATEAESAKPAAEPETNTTDPSENTGSDKS